LSLDGGKRGSRMGRWVAKRLEEIQDGLGMPRAKRVYRNQGKRVSQDSLRECIDKLGAPADELRFLVNPDIFWDSIRSITAGGRVRVFDRHVPAYHNFVANGIVVHNSGAQEADADAVLLLYREQEGSNAFKLKVAKQRNGRIGTVNLTWMGDAMQFKDGASEIAQPY
jgi:hypothetical protein